MLDPTEYDPNSKDLTDDPNFLGDNDHGDAIPPPRCASCGVTWADHMGIMGVCLNNKALKEDLKDSLEAHDEMRLEIAQLTKERDEAAQQINALLLTVKNLEFEIETCKTWLEQSDAKSEQLRTERNEARRMYCEVDNCTRGESLIIAENQGWDCYDTKKEGTA